MKLLSNQILELFIRSLGSSGEGIGTYEGFIVFIEGALPGEKVRVSLTEIKKNYAKGKLLAVLIPSPDRVEPSCPLFGHCGGCQLMHLSYPKQLESKQQTVQNALSRIGHINVPVEQCISSPYHLHYRNKIQMPIVLSPTGLTIGLYARHSHNVIPIDKCFIHCELGEKIYRKIATILKQSGVSPYQEGEGVLRHLLIKTAIHTQEILVILVTSGQPCAHLQTLGKEIMKSSPEVKGVVQNINRLDNNVILGNEWVTLCGSSSIVEEICGKKFRISPAAFFQVNPLQAEAIYQHVLELSQLDETKTFLDAFCGVGIMAILTAPYTKHSFGIECVSSAIEDAQFNAQLNHLENCTFYCGQAESKIHALKNIDVVFLNPPRKGCEENLLKRLNEKLVKEIIYMSCDPATLARDLKILTDLGYRINRVTPFDMFPQTAHVETVVHISKK